MTLKYIKLELRVRCIYAPYTLDNNKDMNPDNSIIVKMKLNIASPEDYS